MLGYMVAPLIENRSQAQLRWVKPWKELFINVVFYR